MTVKTYSRARVAVAAAKALCESVGVVPVEIVAFEMEPGRFTARIMLSDAAHLGAFAEATGFLISAPEPAPVEEEAPVEAAPAPVKKSGYIHEISSTIGPTKMVWRIADTMKGKPRKEVIEACRKAGIAYGTARTQYQEWKRANGL